MSRFIEGGGYPDNNPKTLQGSKKIPTHVVPPIAFYVMGMAMEDGARKYGPYNWREKSISSSVYIDAAKRHIDLWWDGEQKAADSGVHHLGHAMACLALVLDSEYGGSLNDDRPAVNGALAELFAEREADQKPKTLEERMALVCKAVEAAGLTHDDIRNAFTTDR